MNHDQDPYRGLPSLSRLEADLERSERHLAQGFASRHLRLIAGAGAALAIGFGFSPVGPAFGGEDEPSSKAGVLRTAEVKVADAPGIKIGAPAGAGGVAAEGMAPTLEEGSGAPAVRTMKPVKGLRIEKTGRVRAVEVPRQLNAESLPFPPLRAEARPFPPSETKRLKRTVDDA